jgi:hypothetical protein
MPVLFSECTHETLEVLFFKKFLKLFVNFFSKVLGRNLSINRLLGVLFNFDNFIILKSKIDKFH